MAVRESINRVKIEKWRISKVPVNTAEEIYQGDMMTWDDQNHRATMLTAAASAGNFMGLAETQSWQSGLGSLSPTTDKTDHINVLSEGLVTLIAGEEMTVYPWDYVTVGGTPNDAQHIVKTGATADNHIGVVDPSVKAAGKTYAIGAEVRVWLRGRGRFIGTNA